MFIVIMAIPILIIILAAFCAYFLGKMTHRKLVKNGNENASLIRALVIIFSFLVIALSLCFLYVINLDFSRGGGEHM